MKQVLVKKGQAIVVETPAPAITPQNVMVEVKYSLISTGTEIANIQRSKKSLIQRISTNPENIKKVLQMVQAKGLRGTLGVIKEKTQAETITGYSCSGRVVRVGEEIRDLKVGDLVACAGAGKANHAEYVSVPRNLLVKIPNACSLEDAASVTLGAIALQGVRRADVRIGETVAVIGLGLIGQITAQILRAAGCRVIGIDIDPARVELACSLGMDYGVNPLEEDVERRIYHLSSGIGTDATIITADSKDDTIIQQAMEITRKKGTVVIVGNVGMNLQRHPFYKKEIDLLISCSYGPGRYDHSYEEKGIDYPLPYVRWTENRNMAAYLDLLANKKVDFGALVHARHPLAEAGKAFRSLSEGANRPLAILLCYESKEKIPAPRPSSTVRLHARQVSGRIRVGLVGCGSFAVEMHLPNLQNLGNDYAIRALAGRDGAKVQMIGKRYGAAYTTTDYHEILDDDDIDMVLISTRHNLHARMAIDALRAGKAVFLEKPLATTAEDLDLMKKVMQDSGKSNRLMVGFNRRFSQAAKRAKEIVGGRVNPLIIIYRVNAGYIPLDHWVHTEEGGGRIIGECCHMLDLFRYLVGVPAVSVDVSSITPSRSHISNIDNIAVTLKYEDGSLCTLIYTSLGAKEVEKETVEIFCDNTVLVIHDYNSLEVRGSKQKGWRGTRTDKGHVAELLEFAGYLRGKSDAPIPFTEAVETTELSFLIDKMARSDLDYAC